MLMGGCLGRRLARPAAGCCLAICVALGLAITAPRSFAFDASATLELAPVIVTANSADGKLRGSPHSVSVLTAADIARSTASNLSELLSSQANVNLRSYYGRDGKASIDIRGMGATANSNVLVLVDGVRMNENDQSGADLSAIALEQIERIEILRGGGAVRYGGGAVGGVVNIITRQGAAGRRQVDVQAKRASFDTTSWQALYADSGDQAATTLSASGQDSAGHRQNSRLHARDAAAQLRWFPKELGPLTELYLRATQHRDRMGLPSGLNPEQFASGEAGRAQATDLLGFSESQDSRATLGADWDFDSAGSLAWHVSARERSNPFQIMTSPGQIESTAYEWQLHYELPLPAGARQHHLRLGWQSYQSDYSRRRGAADENMHALHQGSAQEHGVYIETTVAVAPTWTVLTGLRENWFKTLRVTRTYDRNAGCQFDYTDPNVPIEIPGSCTGAAYIDPVTQGGSWRARAAEVGLTWQPDSALTAFASLSQHFRNPNIDDLALAAPDLRPQQGRTAEAGLRYIWSKEAQGGITVFQMRNSHEIYLGNTATEPIKVNRNYEFDTQRTGAEADLRWSLGPTLTLRANLGYTDARFIGMAAELPLVPQLTANVEFEWALRPAMQAVLSVRHTGSRPDGDMRPNAPYQDLPAYTVCDLAWRVKLGSGRLALAVKNVFDRAYATLAYSELAYPMPPRNFSVTGSWRFD